MPWEVRKGLAACPGRWAVVVKATGKPVGCHDTEGQAQAHLRALYANAHAAGAALQAAGQRIFTVVHHHRDCPPHRPYGVAGPGGGKVSCHPDQASAQDLALRLNIPDATAVTPGGGIDVGAAFNPAQPRDKEGKWLAEALKNLPVRKQLGFRGHTIDTTANKGYRVRLKGGEVRHYQNHEDAARAAREGRHHDAGTVQPPKDKPQPPGPPKAPGYRVDVKLRPGYELPPWHKPEHATLEGAQAEARKLREWAGTGSGSAIRELVINEHQDKPGPPKAPAGPPPEPPGDGGLDDVRRRLSAIPDLLGVGGQLHSTADRRLAGAVGDIHDELAEGPEAADWKFIRSKMADLAAAEQDAARRGDEGDTRARGLAAALAGLHGALEGLAGRHDAPQPPAGPPKDKEPARPEPPPFIRSDMRQAQAELDRQAGGWTVERLVRDQADLMRRHLGGPGRTMLVTPPDGLGIILHKDTIRYLLDGKLPGHGEDAPKFPAGYEPPGGVRPAEVQEFVKLHAQLGNQVAVTRDPGGLWAVRGLPGYGGAKQLLTTAQVAGLLPALRDQAGRPDPKRDALRALAGIAMVHGPMGSRTGKRPTAAQLGVLGRLTADEAALMARHLTGIHVIAGSKITQAAAQATIGAGFKIESGHHVIGLYWQSSRRLAVTQRELDDQRSSTTMHEVGHALDHAYGQAAMSDEFHALDARVLSAAPNPAVHYHPKKNVNGVLAATRERFAELYGQYKMGQPYDLGGQGAGHRIDAKLTADLNRYFAGLHAARASRITAAARPDDYLCVALDDGTYDQPDPEPVAGGPQAAVAPAPATHLVVEHHAACPASAPHGVVRPGDQRLLACEATPAEARAIAEHLDLDLDGGPAAASRPGEEEAVTGFAIDLADSYPPWLYDATEADWAVHAAAAPERHGNAERLREYWTHGEGGKTKVRWGEPGDFDRCVAHVSKFMANPQGYCDERHHDALGYWPAQHAEMEKGHAAAREVAAQPAWNPDLHPRGPGGQFGPGTGGGARPTPTNQNPVRQGASGEQVRQLQERLNQLGAKPRLNEDGKFGPVTRAAVRQYQATHLDAHGHPLKVDGLVGPLTTGALRQAKQAPAGKGRPAKAAFNPAERRDDHGATGLADLMGEVAQLRDSLGRRRAAAPATVTVPALVTIPGVDILAAGTWGLSTGRQTFTRADLEHAVEAAQCPAVGNPVIKLGHLDQRFAPPDDGDGEPAIGRVTNLKLTAGGTKLTGDLAGMPGWLGVIAASAFPRRSVEGTYGHRCQIGHDHPFVITALALLGVTPPGVGVLGGLPDIGRLYGVTAAAGAWRTEPADQEGAVMPVTEEDVRRAYYASGGAPPSWWITELQMSPAQLIVADEQSGKTYRVPFSIEGSAVAFDPPAELATYADVAAARGTGPVITWASAEESRADLVVTAAWDGSAQVSAMGDDPPASAIKAMFAIPGGSKTDSSLPHHAVSDGKVGAADPDGCAAAIAAINGARGGLKGVGADRLRTAYNHLAAHLRAAGREPPEFAAAGPGKGGASSEHPGQPSSDAPGDPASSEPGGAPTHPPFDGTHTHPHAAYGDQGGDTTHEHAHTHRNDAVHDHTHAAGPAGGTNGGGSDMEFTADQLAGIRAKLGLNDGQEVTAEDIAAAFTAPAAPQPGQVAASGGEGGLPPIGDGTYLVDAEILRGYQQRAAAGDAAVATLHRNERDQIIRDAIRDGKFSAARQEHYERRWQSDPEGARAEIGALASGLVPVGTGPVGKMGFDPDLGGDFEGQQAYRDLFPDDVHAAAQGQPGIRQGGAR